MIPSNPYRRAAWQWQPTLTEHDPKLIEYQQGGA